jgi:hypothetical protein
VIENIREPMLNLAAKTASEEKLSRREPTITTGKMQQ